MSPRRLLAAFLPLFFVIPPLVSADGDVRLATQEERLFLEGTFDQIAQALPPDIPGWTETLRTRSEDRKYVTPGAEDYPLTVEASVAWEDSQTLERARQAESEELEAMVNQGAFQAPDQGRLTAEMERLAQALGKAAERGDGAAVQLASEQLAELGKQLNAMGQSQEELVQQVTRKHRALDSHARVEIRVNASGGNLYRSQAHAPIAGHQALRSSPDEETGMVTTWVLVGPFQSNLGEYGYDIEATWREGTPHTKVQNLLIEVEASPERSDALLAGIAWKRLEKLLR